MRNNNRWLPLALLALLFMSVTPGNVFTNNVDQGTTQDTAQKVVITPEACLEFLNQSGSTELIYVGDFLRFDAKNCEVSAWDILCQFGCMGDKYVDSGGQTLIVIPRSVGTFHTVAATKDGKLLKQTYEVKQASKPLPPVRPDEDDITPPPPPPPPTPVDDLTGWIKQKAPELIKSQFFEREVKTVSEVFSQYAQKISNNELRVRSDAEAKLARDLVSTLVRTGRTDAPWRLFFKELQVKIDEEMGSSTDIKQLGSVYNTIAEALKGAENAQ